LSKGLRTSLVVRSRLAEDEWASASARGVQQCVILGAGLDTFAYRCQHTEGRFYEVDLPSTQMWKQECLREAGIAVPDSLIYVPIDFESSTLSQGLERAGFDVKLPAFFIWLGVTMYLQEQAVLDTLRFIASCAKGSGVVFDYVVPASCLPLMLRAPIEMMAKHLADRGEPWKCYFEPAALEAKVSALGFGQFHNFTPTELNQRYLPDRQDGLQLGGLTRLMHAQV
jgi:methyltransferase (TIGR00027 family)